MNYGQGTAFEGAAASRLLGDWLVEQRDVNDDWWQDARALAARHWWSYNNDPHARAIAETLCTGVFGAEGLRFKSLCAFDNDADTSEEERVARRQIDFGVMKSLSGTRADVAGHLTHRELSITLYLSRIMAGDGYAVRQWREKRPGCPRSTCWRVIDPSRVSNPGNGANTPDMFEGHELGKDGGTVAIHVQAAHPNMIRVGQDFTWKRIPIYAKDGSRQVIHTKRVRRPDQIRGFGILSAGMLSLRMLSESAKAWVAAKRIQASIGLLVYCEDPKAMKRADKNGALLGDNVGIKPGIKWYIHKDNKVEPLNFNFQGADFEMFRNPVMEAICASVGLPFEYVMQRLTKSNMASSRTALGQAYATFRAEQEEHIQQVERHLIDSAIREEISLGNVDLKTDDLDLITRGKWSRPAKLSPDPLKEAMAVREWSNLGASLTNGFAEAGKDFDTEVSQRAQDDGTLAAQGVSISGDTIAERVKIEADPPTPYAPADGAPPADDPTVTGYET